MMSNGQGNYGREFAVVGSTSRDPSDDWDDMEKGTVFNGNPYTLQIVL
jgi:hypothetical protein